MFSCSALDQAHQVGLPNSRGQSFAGDVAYYQSKDGVELHHFEEVAREMAHGENFSGDLELTRDEFARSAKLALHLSRLIDGLLQLGMLVAYGNQFLFDGMHGLRRLCLRGGRLVPIFFSECVSKLLHSALPCCVSSNVQCSLA